MNDKFQTDCLNEVVRKVRAAKKDAPSQRKLFKTGYSFSAIQTNEQILIWDFIWNSGPDIWTMLQAFFYCENLLKKDTELISVWPVIKKWQDKVDNWGLSDCLSKIFSKLLEIDPGLVYQTLSQWNKSEDPWKRRQSLVSLIYYSSVRKTVLPFKKQIKFIRKLLPDENYFVQKGVGWTLRELGNVYPDSTWNFILDNVKKISLIAFTAAIEKLDKTKKEKLIQIRKGIRSYDLPRPG